MTINQKNGGVLMSNTQTVLELQHISKSFPGVKALDDVNFALKKGTVHVYAEKMVPANPLL